MVPDAAPAGLRAVARWDRFLPGALYIAAHAGIKSAPFLCAGVILNRYGSVDELDLYGRGRNARIMPWLFLLAALALSGLPPFGTALGKAVAEESVSKSGVFWGPALFVVVSALTGGAVLRAGLRIYWGLGRRPDSSEKRDETEGQEEVEQPLSRVRLSMLTPILVLLLGGLVLAVLVACTALYADRLPGVLTAAARPVGRALTGLRQLHSGHVGDYVAWLVVGVAALGLLLGPPTALSCVRSAFFPAAPDSFCRWGGGGGRW